MAHFAQTELRCGDLKLSIEGLRSLGRVAMITDYFFATNQFQALQRFTDLVCARDLYYKGEIAEAQKAFDEAYLTDPGPPTPKPHREVPIPSWGLILGIPGVAVVLIVLIRLLG